MKKTLLDSSLGYLLNRTSLKLNNLLAKRLKDYDITTEQFVLLSRLMEEDGISQRELALRSEKDSPGVTRMLDNMIAKDLIIRDKDQIDRRTFAIYLTEKARLMYEDLQTIEMQTMKDIGNGLSEEQIQELKYLLSEIKKNIEQENNRE